MTSADNNSKLSNPPTNPNNPSTKGAFAISQSASLDLANAPVPSEDNNPSVLSQLDTAENQLGRQSLELRAGRGSAAASSINKSMGNAPQSTDK